MAHTLQSFYSSVSRAIFTQASYSHNKNRASLNKKGSHGRISKKQRRCWEGLAVHCSWQEFVALAVGRSAEAKVVEEWEVKDYGWQVRRLCVGDEAEMREATFIQAQAFHTPMAFLDDLFFEFFKAEVLAGLLYKLRNSPANRYACLVAEPESDSDWTELSKKKIMGVVDLTALRDDAVLRHLSGAKEYLYVSGLAVSPSFRRRKIGSALLKACDAMSLLWGFRFLALRVYEDDLGARKLYTAAGYRVVSGDLPWTTTWIGRKRRLLMIKQFHQTL